MNSALNSEAPKHSSQDGQNNNDSFGQNQFVCTAALVAKSVVRYNPRGLPIIEFEIEHKSEQLEANATRVVVCAIKAIAMGVVCEQVQRVELGEFRVWSGFLAQRSVKSNSLRFHVSSLSNI